MEFAPRKNVKDYYLLFVVFGFFMVIGLVFLSGAMDGVGKVTVDKTPFLFANFSPEQKIGFFFTLLPTLAFLLAGPSIFAIKKYYRVTNEGLEIGVGPLAKPKTLLFSEIGKVSIVGHEVVEQHLVRVYSNKDMVNIFGAVRGYVDTLRFITQPVSINAVGYRHGLPVTAATDGDFVMLEMKDGRVYFASPVDVAGLCDTLASYLRS